jgi:pyridoxal phosphate enzyme (YggS family)
VTTPHFPDADDADGDVACRLAAVRDRVAAACRRAGRATDEVRLIGVTKTIVPQRIRAAAAAGLGDFAENYAAELEAKASLVPATWHFVGTLQRGTAHRVAAVADVVHTAEPGHAFERLARRAAEREPALPCLVQVDLVGGRHGVDPSAVLAFVDAAANVAGVRLVGLMTLPPPTPHPDGARPWFARLRELRDRLAADAPWLRELSMGMSADYEVAIEEGATMVRVGTALFGARPAGPRARSDPRERGGT